MQTNFIELLSATAPAGLEQTIAALCGEVKGLLQSANKWLREQRIGQIRRDLKYHYDRPLREIAEKNGFESANRFWEFCTEQMKQSPSELHKELYDELCAERRKFYLGE